MSRRKTREHIFKLLFRIEFNEMEDMEEQVALFFNTKEVEINDEEKEYITTKYQNIVDKISEIDCLIEEKAISWKATRMGKVDLTIIRLAVYEIQFDDDVPPSVAINEAVEIAKKFGQDESASFINGVLAKFALEK